jgi:translation initiation factor IF-3
MNIKFNRNSRERIIVEPEHKINERIRAIEVRLINEDGSMAGVMSRNAAQRIADDLELDLVELSPNASPPVCKIMDYSKFVYEKKKKEKLNKKNSKATKLKEITIRPAINEHDYQTKLKHARGFLEKGDKVKIMIKMRGRELQHTSENTEVLKKFIDGLADISKVEQEVKAERSPMVILQPKDPLSGK